MLLKVDGYDVRWESDVNWAGQDGNHHDEDMSTIFRNHYQRHKNATPYTDYSMIGVEAVVDRYDITHLNVIEEVEETHAVLRKKLVDHYCYNYQNQNIQWLK